MFNVAHRAGEMLLIANVTIEVVFSPKSSPAPENPISFFRRIALPTVQNFAERNAPDLDHDVDMVGHEHPRKEPVPQRHHDAKDFAEPNLQLAGPTNGIHPDHGPGRLRFL